MEKEAPKSTRTTRSKARQLALMQSCDLEQADSNQMQGKMLLFTVRGDREHCSRMVPRSVMVIAGSVDPAVAAAIDAD